MVKRSAATLADVAAAAGVSTTTVSNAYNRPDQLSPKVRAEVLRTARRLGYPGPNPAARSLRTATTGTIGVLLTEHLSYAFDDRASVDFIAGLAADSREALTLLPVGPHSGVPSDVVSRAAVDGFIVYSVAERDPHLKAVLRRPEPVVICDQPTGVSGAPFIGIDDRAAIAPAARAVVEAGHQQVGVLAIRLFTQPTDGVVTLDDVGRADYHVQRARVLGAADILGERLMGIVTRDINTVDNATAAAHELLIRSPGITAIVCTTDTMALGALRAAAERGLRVPDDLSITGFDGVETALELGVTTVVQPNREKGRAAGRALRELIAGGSPESVTLATSLRKGRTLAPAPTP